MLDTPVEAVTPTVEPKKSLAEQIKEAKEKREAEEGKKRNTIKRQVDKAVVKRVAAKPIKKSTPKPAPKAKAKPQAAKQPAKAARSRSDEAICSMCGKPLSRHTSVEAGMGDICRMKLSWLPKGVTLEQHYERITVNDVPDGFIKFADAYAKAREKGTSGYRFIQAIGGDRMIRKPINSNFKVVIVKGVRYINRDSLKHLSDLEKK